MSDTDPGNEEKPEEQEARPLTGEPPSPAAMRLRAEPPRVTRLSRKVLAGLALVASVGIGGALVYALQTRDGSRPNEELYSTESRPTADGISGLPRDYSGVPQLGPPLPATSAVRCSVRRTAVRPLLSPVSPRLIPVLTPRSSAVFRNWRPRGPRVCLPRPRRDPLVQQPLRRRRTLSRRHQP